MKATKPERNVRIALTVNEARLLREVTGVAQYDCKQEHLGLFESIFAQLNRKLSHRKDYL